MNVEKTQSSNTIGFFSPITYSKMEIPLMSTSISAGFPSPADDYIELKLDLNKELIKHPHATFFCRVKGDSMVEAGINDGDILIIDKSLEPKTNSVLVCFLDGEFIVKRVKQIDAETIHLVPDNKNMKPITVSKENDLRIWGVVTYSIQKY